MTTPYSEARERIEDATDCSGAAREDHEVVAVTVGDLRALLAGPDREEVARVIAGISAPAPHGRNYIVSGELVMPLTDAIRSLYGSMKNE